MAVLSQLRPRFAYILDHYGHARSRRRASVRRREGSSNYTKYIGWVGVGWQRRCKTRQSLHELGNQATLFVFWWSPWLAVEFYIMYVCGWRTLTPHQGNDFITQCVIVVYMIRHPRGSDIVYALLSLEVATPKNTLIDSTLSSI